MTDPSHIRLIISDIDGVWTDGRIIYLSDNREIKEFNVRDGLGVKLAQKRGIQVAVVTSRSSSAVERRCRELGIEIVVQGSSDKRAAVETILERVGVTDRELCYIGDDLPDLGPIHLAGLSAAPADAVQEVRSAVDWKLDAQGGAGAFRELVERLLKTRGEWEMTVHELEAATLDTPPS